MDLAAVKANRQVYRECLCPTHTAVRQLIAYAEELEALGLRSAARHRELMPSFRDPQHHCLFADLQLVELLERPAP